MDWKMAEKWVKDLNNSGYAGYHDWRLPTVEEAASLLESSKKNRDLYIDPIFSNKLRWIWTGDKKIGSERAWHVYFNHGRYTGATPATSMFVQFAPEDDTLDNLVLCFI